MGDGKIAVGIKNNKRSVGALKWALDNLVAAGDDILLIHVQHPIRYVPTPVGNLAVGQISAEKVADYRRSVQQKIDAFVAVSKRLCSAKQINPTYVQVENDSVQKALVEQISEFGIHKLVLGSSNRKGLARKLSGSGIATYVSNHAPSFCCVVAIYKNKVVLPKEADDCRSVSSISTRTTDSEGSELLNVSSSSSSSQGETEVHPPRLHGLPEGLGHRWSFLSRYLSFGSPSASSPVPETPLDEIPGAKVFVSPFREPEPETAEEGRSSSVDVSNGTLALASHKLSGESSSSSDSKALTKPESHSSSGTKSVASSESDGQGNTRAVMLKTVLDAETEEELATSDMSRMDISSQSTFESFTEAPSTPQRKRKTLRELAMLARKNFREYDYSDLEAATGKFSEQLKLGEGGYGLVYKGKLQGKTVAIKVLKKEGFQRTQEFQHEVELLGRIQHPHMVVLLGCCSERGCLVYEFMANGSLDDRLFCKNGTPPLPWYSRFRIAAEVASALHFLHNLGPEPVVHRDLKPANILLDHKFVSKVGDVGLAKLVPERYAAINSTYYRDTNPVGTFAYIDPEYQRTGLFGPKSDVYALGIVILQLLTGRPPVGVHAIVEEAIECGNFSSILDQSAGDWPLAKAEEVACLALQCAEMRRRQRPNLDTVLPMLEAARNYAENCAAISATKKAIDREVVPSIFFCPIFQEVMEEPVVAADGYTYEYEAIRQWFQAHDTSPLTNLKLEHKQLTPHHALHKLINEWKARNKA